VTRLLDSQCSRNCWHSFPRQHPSRRTKAEVWRPRQDSITGCRSARGERWPETATSWFVVAKRARTPVATKRDCGSSWRENTESWPDASVTRAYQLTQGRGRELGTSKSTTSPWTSCALSQTNALGPGPEQPLIGLTAAPDSPFRGGQKALGAFLRGKN
jgi:hypothetical protein